MAKTPLEKQNGYLVLDYLMTRTYEITQSTQNVSSDKYLCYSDCLQDGSGALPGSLEFGLYAAAVNALCIEDPSDSTCSCLTDCDSWGSEPCVETDADRDRNAADAAAAHLAYDTRVTDRNHRISAAAKNVTDAINAMNKKIAFVERSYGAGRDTLITEKMWKIGKNDVLPSVIWWSELGTTPFELMFNGLYQMVAGGLNPNHKLEDGPIKSQAHQDVNDWVVDKFSSLTSFIGSALNNGVNNGIKAYNGISDDMQHMGVNILNAFGAQMDSNVNPGYDSSASTSCCTYKCNVSPGSKNRPSVTLQNKLKEFALNKYKLPKDPINSLIEGNHTNNVNCLKDIESLGSTDSDPLFIPGDDFAGLTATQIEAAGFMGILGMGGTKQLWDSNLPDKYIDNVLFDLKKTNGLIDGIEKCTLNGKPFPNPATASAAQIEKFNKDAYLNFLKKQFTQTSVAGHAQMPGFYDPTNKEQYLRFVDNTTGGKIIRNGSISYTALSDDILTTYEMRYMDTNGEMKTYKNERYSIKGLMEKIKDIRLQTRYEEYLRLSEFVKNDPTKTAKTVDEWINRYLEALNPDGTASRLLVDGDDLDEIKKLLQKKLPDRIVLSNVTRTAVQMGGPCLSEVPGCAYPEHGRGVPKVNTKTCPVTIPVLINEGIVILPNELQSAYDELGNLRTPAIIASDPSLPLNGDELSNNAGNMTLEEAKCTYEKQYKDFVNTIQAAKRNGTITETMYQSAKTGAKIILQNAYSALKAGMVAALGCFIIACDEVEKDCIRDLTVVRQLELNVKQKVKDFFALRASLQQSDTVRQEYGQCWVETQGACLDWSCNFKGCNDPNGNDGHQGGRNCNEYNGDANWRDMTEFLEYDFGCTTFWTHWQDHIPVNDINRTWFGFPYIPNPKLGDDRQTKNFNLMFDMPPGLD